MQLTTCGCAFDAASFTAHDRATARRWLGAMADQAIEGVDLDLLAGGRPGAALQALHARIGGLDPDAPDVDAVHDAIHLLHDLGRELHAAGAGVPQQVGTVVQLSASGGGVPKSAVDAVDVGFDGVVGDRQANRKHHGRPFQALCLWSADVMEALRAEGHTVHPGATGENVTVAGIDWATLRPGARLRIGEALCELSAWATPCRKIDAWFTGRSDRILHDTHPGWSRVYAWVLEPGAIRTGDEVVVEP
ncbi:MAG TPA: MOSC domain-containing protein [Acidimicrobiales bacterium]|nr:MOSC domain-containing protein [Acidimicrobiales bacterium]